jgi:hypothetical protein
MQAPTREAAKAAVVQKFDLDDEKRSRLMVQERD